MSQVNTDAKNIHEALKTALQLYEISCRGHGRTFRMLESVKPGDMILCLGSLAAHNLRVLLKERGIESVRVRICDPDADSAHVATAGLAGRIHLDHMWVHAFFMKVLSDAVNRIDLIENGRDILLSMRGGVRREA